MTLLLDGRGEEIPQDELPSNQGCPKCGRQQRETFRGFGKTWKELCGHCGYQFASGTGVPPMEGE